MLTDPPHITDHAGKGHPGKFTQAGQSPALAKFTGNKKTPDIYCREPNHLNIY